MRTRKSKYWMPAGVNYVIENDGRVRIIDEKKQSAVQMLRESAINEKESR